MGSFENRIDLIFGINVIPESSKIDDDFLKRIFPENTVCCISNPQNDILSLARSGIDTDEKLQYVATTYYRMSGAQRTQVLARFSGKESIEILNFLKLAAIDPEVAPCLQAARIAKGIADEKIAPVFALLLTHPDKSVRMAARRGIFELRSKGLALRLEAEEHAKDSEAWWKSALPLHKVVFWTKGGDGKIGVIIARKRPDGDLAAFGVLVDPVSDGIRDAMYAPAISEKRFEESLATSPDDSIHTWTGSEKELIEVVRFGYEISASRGGSIPLAFNQGKFLLGDAAVIFEDFDVYKCRSCGADLEFGAEDNLRNSWHIEKLPDSEFLCNGCRAIAYPDAPAADAKLMLLPCSRKSGCRNCPRLAECERMK
jgi:hypothetical protein